ncbi:infection structure specific protein [Apiospora saccharicola]|uniref:Infection structure specific protein n=1 Tax=Apiospora saccharicola TaxID=335842 RepID=A0ABR1UJH8_9PEZI
MHAPSVFTALFFALAAADSQFVRPAADKPAEDNNDNQNNGPVIEIIDKTIIAPPPPKTTATPTPTPSSKPAPVAHREALDAKCTQALQEVMPLYKLVPTPPAALAAVPLPTDPCQTPTFNGTLSAQYASYTSEVGDWYKSHSSEILGALSKCPALMDMASDVPFCKTTSTSSTSIAKPTAAPTTAAAKPPTAESNPDDKSDSSNALNASSQPSDTPEKSGAQRITAVVGLAIAAASFMGAVVAL